MVRWFGTSPYPKQCCRAPKTLLKKSPPLCKMGIILRKTAAARIPAGFWLATAYDHQGLEFEWDLPALLPIQPTQRSLPFFPRAIPALFPMLSHRRWKLNRQLNPMEYKNIQAIRRSFGSYDHTKGGHIVFADDHEMLKMPVGTTVLFSAGTKSSVAAGVLRWVDKGGRTDRQFAWEASLEERAAWEDMRQQRGQTSLKSFSKLRDVYIC
ncbi:hypothetical protein B0H14DRAFT_2576247 [Mycena olivaceomarginata]|nr:hypothetical protein B0H14DRAFT_2576247 [Mycena olivaceomarginata]